MYNSYLLHIGALPGGRSVSTASHSQISIYGIYCLTVSSRQAESLLSSRQWADSSSMLQCVQACLCPFFVFEKQVLFFIRLKKTSFLPTEKYTNWIQTLTKCSSVIKCTICYTWADIKYSFWAWTNQMERLILTKWCSDTGNKKIACDAVIQ